MVEEVAGVQKKYLLPATFLGVLIATSACSAPEQNTGMTPRTTDTRTPENVTYRGTAPYAYDRTAPLPSGVRPGSDLSRPSGSPGRTADRWGQTGAHNTRSQVAQDLNAVASRMADQATTVSGVKSATTMIVGNTAYIGLDLGNHVTGTRGTAIEQTVANTVARAFPEYDIRVTSDKGFWQRITNLGNRLPQGYDDGGLRRPTYTPVTPAPTPAPAPSPATGTPHTR